MTRDHDRPQKGTNIVENEDSRNVAIANLARRLARNTQLDFADALIEAQTAFWLVEQRPTTDTKQHGYGGVANQAFALVVDYQLRDEGVRSRGVDDRTPSCQWPPDYDPADSSQDPAEVAVWADLSRRFFERVREAVGTEWGWVVDAVENGYRTIPALGEWRLRIGLPEDRQACKAGYEVYRWHSRRVW